MTTAYEELAAAKKLLDQGIITQEEFDAKKAQLLADEATAGAAEASATTPGATAAPTASVGAAPASKEPLKKKTGLIIGIVAAAVVVVAAAAFAVTTLMPNDHGSAIVGEWSGDFFTDDTDKSKSLSSNIRVKVNADHTLTFGGGSLDMREGTWKFMEEDKDKIVYEAEFDDLGTVPLLLVKQNPDDTLSLIIGRDLILFFER